MKLNIKLFLVVASSLAAGFVACLVLAFPMERQQTSRLLAVTEAAVAFTQAQPEMFVLTARHDELFQQKAEDTIRFVPGVELIRSRSLHLIDAQDRYQQKSDFRELNK